MKTDKKNTLDLLIFWVALLVLIVPWLSLIGNLKEHREQKAAKLLLSAETFNQHTKEVDAFFRAAKEKGDSYSVEDFQWGIYKLWTLERELCKNYRLTSWQGDIAASWKSSYSNQFLGPLKERMVRKGISIGMAINQAQNKVLREGGYKGLFEGFITKAVVLKFIEWLFLFAWPISILLALFLYIYRCQISNDISFKELVFSSPLEFLGFLIFWPMGLMFKYPEGEFGLYKRYLKLKSHYLLDKEWGHWLSKQEEQILWQQARAPIDKFDKGVKQTLVYSRAVAFASSLFIWIFVAPFQNLKLYAVSKGDAKIITKVSEREEKKKKSAIKIFDIDNFKFGGLVQTKAVKKDGELIWGKRAQLKGRGEIIKIKDFNLSYAWKADFSKDKPSLPMFNLEASCPWIEFINRISFGRILDPSFQALPPHLSKTINLSYYSSLPTDVGICISGNVGKQLKCNLAALNGNGFFDWQDDNKAKDVSANLIWSISKDKLILGIDSLRLRTVYRSGKQSNGNRLIWGNDFSLKKGIFTAEGGYILKREGEQNKDCKWLLVFATIDGKWQFLLQWEYQNGKGWRLTSGLNFIIDRNRRFQINFEKTPINSSLLFQYQITF